MINAYVFKKRVDIYLKYIFICGSYYDGKPFNKRVIIKNVIDTDFKNLFPIIIDKSFNIDRFEDKNLNIRIMEEIIANVAQSTIVLVESFSSSAELGLFASSGKNNNIAIVIPKKIDVEYNKIGYFVENAFKSVEDNDTLTVISYRPAVRRVAINSNIIDEHYYFIDNKLPMGIREYLNKVNNLTNQYEIIINSSSNDFSLPLSLNEIKYSSLVDSVNIKISTFLTFHLIVHDLLTNYMIDKRVVIPDVLSFYESIVNTIKNTLIFNDSELRKKRKFQVHIESDINVGFEILVHHIVNIVKLFTDDELISSKYRKFSKIDIIDKISIDELEYTIWDALSISKDDMLLPNKKNTETIQIKRKNKIREVTKYSDDDNGTSFRQFHNNIAKEIKGLFKYNMSSFAYQENKGIIDVIERHKHSKIFYMFDIKNFFNSIDISILSSKLLDIFNISDNHITDATRVLNSFFIKDKDTIKLPLGFTISPLLSEIYMKDFDRDMLTYCNGNRLVYSRYADDITISSKKIHDKKLIENYIDSLLKKLNLELNTEKTIFSDTTKKGKYVKILGISLTRVEQNKKLYISTGNKYIRSLAKDICGYGNLDYDKVEYLKKRFRGEIGFIRYVNPADCQKLFESIRKISKERFESIIKLYDLNHFHYINTEEPSLNTSECI